jgi:hypothetical protein
VGTDWAGRFGEVDGERRLDGRRSFARLFDGAGVPDAAVVVDVADDDAAAYLVRPADAPRLVEAVEDAELLFGALPDALDGREQGEWREIPEFVPRLLRATADWVVLTACLRRAGAR